MTPKMTFSVNGRAAYVSMQSVSPLLKNHGWTGNYGANWNYTAPQNIKLSAFGGQTVNLIQLQGSFSGWYYYGIGVSRSFLKKDALTVAVNASNFLEKKSDFSMTTHSGDYLYKLSVRQNSWHAGVQLTWNFGSLNGTTKKTDLNILNDDHTEGNGGKGGISI